MNVVFHGYRSWALRIARNLIEHKNNKWRIVEQDDSAESVHLYYGWSWMLPKEEYEKHLCLILHTSPLPKYRGGSPLQNQIIAGEKMSAATILKVAERVDSGEIYAQSPFSLDGSVQDIFDRLTEVGTRDTIKVLDQIADRTIQPLVQDESQATTYKRRKPEESEIPHAFNQMYTAKEMYDFIRALADPYPNAYVICRDGQKLYFTGARIDE